LEEKRARRGAASSGSGWKPEAEPRRPRKRSSRRKETGAEPDAMLV